MHKNLPRQPPKKRVSRGMILLKFPSENRPGYSPDRFSKKEDHIASSFLKTQTRLIPFFQKQTSSPNRKMKLVILDDRKTRHSCQLPTTFSVNGWLLRMEWCIKCTFVDHPAGWRVMHPFRDADLAVEFCQRVGLADDTWTESTRPVLAILGQQLELNNSGVR